MRLRLPRRRRHTPQAEPATQRLPERGPAEVFRPQTGEPGSAPPGRTREHRGAPAAQTSDPGSAPTARRAAPEAPPKAGGGSLRAPPSIGRVSSAWRRNLTSSGWPRAGMAADCGSIGRMALTAASSVGRAHAHRGVERQDAYGFMLVSDVLVCAIADGVSSARYSGAAADVAISTALSCLEEWGPSAPEQDLSWLHAAARKARKSVEALAIELFGDEESHEERLAEEHCATTLVLAAVRSQEAGMQLSVLSVGDSRALELTTEGDFKSIVEPQDQPSPEVLLDFLPRPGSRIESARCLLARGSTLLLATDGLAHDIDSSHAVREWVGERLRTASSTVEAAHVLSYARQSSKDDLTYVAVRPNAAG